jgi:hypothetical protein
MFDRTMEMTANEELQNVYYSLNIINVRKSRRITYVAQVITISR